MTDVLSNIFVPQPFSPFCPFNGFPYTSAIFFGITSGIGYGVNKDILSGGID